MRTHPDHPDHFLIELSDLEAPLTGDVAHCDEPVRTIVRWAEDYLCQPHPELGRSGPVCPYVQAAMKKGHFYLTVVPGSEIEQSRIEETTMVYRDWFQELEPTTGQDAGLKTILLIFPDLSQEQVPELIDATQDRLKREYVKVGLMIGEFHAGPPAKAGLWNLDFRPLRSPLPMLVIRCMVPTDFAFLKDDADYVAAYLDSYADRIPAHLRDEVRAAAERFDLFLPDPKELEAVHPTVAAALTRHRVRTRVVRHRDLEQPQDGPRDVARALDWPLGRITKSLFVHSGGDYAIVVCPVDRKVDLNAVARHLGTGRLQLAGQQELSAWLGYSAGGVSPIGAKDVAVVMDASLFDWPTVLTAAGEVAVEIEIDPDELRRVTGASVLPLGSEVKEGVPA